MAAEQALDDWQVTSTAPGTASVPSELDPDLTWVPAACPGTAASAWRDAGRWSEDDDDVDFDAFDWWFRTTFASSTATGPDTDAATVLHFGGIATLADVWLDGEHVLHSENMFVAHDVVVPPGSHHELVVVCRSLTSWLSARRPRGRWKTRLVQQQHLRWARTTLLGRMTTWLPHAAPVGLWRGVHIGPQASAIDDVRLTARVRGNTGTVDFRGVTGRTDSGEAPRSARLVVGAASGALQVEPSPGAWSLSGALEVEDPALWWPHTHGAPVLHPASVELELANGSTTTVPVGSVGFRSIAADRSDDGFALVVNDVAVFCRGACWVPIDPVALSVDRGSLERALRQVVDAGMNMIRITGTMVGEQDELYDLCDQLGVMVWHDLMFANLDYPIDDEAFAASVAVEVGQLLDRLRDRPSLAVVCGGSEVEQQASMMGLDPAETDHRLGHDVLAALVAEHAPDVEYVVNSPSGGAFPFSISTGVSHYYGVGAYRRPLDDARRAGVRFTTECLAFANVGSRESLEPFLDRGDSPAHSPRWKRGVPRDRSVGWDFEDVRDHYVRALFGVDPIEVRYADPDRYLDLGRAAVATVMESTLGEWRRTGSTCHGALVFTMRDLGAGAGWGLVDSDGRTKSAYHAVARASAPIAVWTTDEGLDGVAAHLANDGSGELAGSLVVRLFDAGGAELAAAKLDIALAPHSSRTISVDQLLGGFRDLSSAYRFGPQVIDVLSLQLLDGLGDVVSRSCYLPGGHVRPLLPDLGLQASATRAEDGSVRLALRTGQFAHHVSIDMPGHEPSDNWFHLAPGDERTVTLRATSGVAPARYARVAVRALNSRVVLSANVETQVQP